MATRNKWARRIGNLIAEADAQQFTGNALHHVLGELEVMRLEALEPAELEVFDWIVECNSPVVSQDIATAFGLKQNHASGLLKALMTYGLLDRQLELNDNGRRFAYTLHHL